MPYHDRQIVILPPADGPDWLTLGKPPGEVLRTLPAGALRVTTLRTDGVETNPLPDV